jgi:hypothetical protein
VAEESEDQPVFKPEEVKRFIQGIEEIQGVVLSIKNGAAGEIAAVKARMKKKVSAEEEKIADIFADAEEVGVTKASLEFELFRRQKEREVKAEERRIGADAVQDADELRTALGDFAVLPLGVAAVAAAPPPKKAKGARKGTTPRVQKALAATTAKPKKKGLAGEDTGAKPKKGVEHLKDMKKLDGDPQPPVH